MARFLSRWFVTAAALAVAAWLFDGIWFSGPRQGWAEVEHKILPLLLVALIAAAITVWVKPVLKVLSIPFIIVTLGLFLLVLNALLLLLTAWLADAVGLGFRVDGFWTAVGGSIVITLVTWLLDAVLGAGSDDERSRSREAARR